MPFCRASSSSLAVFGMTELVHALVEGRPQIVPALLVRGERGAIRALQVGVLDVDDEDARFRPGTSTGSSGSGAPM